KQVDQLDQQALSAGKLRQHPGEHGIVQERPRQRLGKARPRLRRGGDDLQGAGVVADHRRGWSTIWVQRNRAMVLPVVWFTASASQTWVERPPCASRASQMTTSPSLAVPRKLALSSMVVKPLAPSGSEAMQP